ncbi:GNAT family N-acetyltransferase [Algibacter sp. AS12]|uniref:GNAT family N-acetyltransferase n=1 Tax=Algibacter sp. AS12 TaxID=3135773 RepID=UPI00398A662A
MGLLNTVNHNFTQNFFEKGDFNPLIGEIYNENKNQNFENPNQNLDSTNLGAVHLIEFVPPFFKLKFNASKGRLSSFKYTYFKGFMCDLSTSKTLEDYMSTQLGKKKKKVVLSRLRRLETCFNIEYKTFYGDISDEECDDLMDAFKTMIIKRFDQRGDIHSSLKAWDFYKEEAANLIRKKKACLFVIYNDNKPISISLNFLCNDIFESAISSYEIDYAKFGLGNIIVLKKIEWCLANGYNIFNMRYGDYPYKRVWCNTVFLYDSYVVYKKSIGKLIRAFVVLKKNQAITYAILNKDKFKALAGFRNKLKGDIKSNNNEEHVNQLKGPVFRELNDYNEADYKNLTPVDIKGEEFTFLRKPIFDLQYIQASKTEDMLAFKIDDNTYLAKNTKINKCFLLELA